MDTNLNRSLADDTLAELWLILCPLIKQKEWYQCLALTWLTVYRSPALVSSELIERTGNAPPDCLSVGQIVDYLDSDNFEEKLSSEWKQSPCSFLTAFDELIEFRYSRENGAISEHPNLFESEKDLHELDANFMTRLGINVEHRKFYVVPAPLHLRSFGTREQDVHPYRYTQHRWVIPAECDLIPPGRMLSFDVPTLVFKQAMEQIIIRNPRLLRIYLAEYITEPLYEAIWQKKKGSNQWVAKSITNWKSLASEAIRHLERAQAQRADIVIFPELCDSAEISEEIREWLLDTYEASQKTQTPLFAMVVTGSHHRKQDTGEWVNRANAFDHQGNCIRALSHEKLTRVQLAKLKIIEGIKCMTGIRVVQSAIGIQAIIICLDLAQSAQQGRIPLENVPFSWLWVPSLSDGVSAHKVRAKELSAQLPICVACTNQGPVTFDPSMDPPIRSNFPPFDSFVMAAGYKDRIVPTQAESRLEGWKYFEVEISPGLDPTPN